MTQIDKIDENWWSDWGFNLLCILYWIELKLGVLTNDPNL